MPHGELDRDSNLEGNEDAIRIERRKRLMALKAQAARNTPPPQETGSWHDEETELKESNQPPFQTPPLPPDDEVARMTIIEEETKEQYSDIQIKKLTQQGIVQTVNPSEQFKLLKQLYPAEFEDVTNDVSLPANIQTGSQDNALILVNDSPFKQGRVYIARPFIVPHLHVTRSVVPTNLNGANNFVLTTNIGSAAYKKVLSVEMVFWTLASRSTKSVVSRTVTIERIIRNPAAISETLTRIVLYQATSTINTPNTTASDLVVTLEPMHLARNEEIQLTLNATAVDIFVDALIYVEVRY